MLFNFKCSDRFYRKKYIVFLWLFCMGQFAFAQDNKEKIQSIGLSLPVIWNHSENPSNPTTAGNAISYGINAHYTRSIYKSFYIKAGLGFFEQSFNIKRYFDDPIQVMHYTKSYNYYNLHLFGGLGYRITLTPGTWLQASGSYHILQSFAQKYTLDHVTKSNNKSLFAGNMANINLGIEKQLHPKITLGIDIVLPVFTNWGEDNRFSFDNQQPGFSRKIANHLFSLGCSITCNYHF
jgi:hypothetical protein